MPSVENPEFYGKAWSTVRKRAYRVHASLDRFPLPLQSTSVAFRHLCDGFRGFDLVLRRDGIVQHVYFPCCVLGELRRPRDLTPMFLWLLLSVPRCLGVQSRTTHQTFVFQLHAKLSSSRKKTRKWIC